jgi:16S rRNA (cytidine1402-2'-O)-methyltransferase
MIFFESPHRLQESVSDALSVFGADRRGAICREMTKTYEETIRGSLLELEQWCQSKEILGEITFLIAGASAAEKMSDDQILAAIDSAELAGLSRKDAIAEVMGESGWSKREIFDLLVARKKMVQGK